MVDFMVGDYVKSVAGSYGRVVAVAHSPRAGQYVGVQWLNSTAGVQSYLHPFHDFEKVTHYDLVQAQIRDNHEKLISGELTPDSPVEHPKHYNSHPSGVECITVAQHHSFNVGNVFKYLWRAGLKGEATELEDLRKARQYLEFEIERIENSET